MFNLVRFVYLNIIVCLAFFTCKYYILLKIVVLADCVSLTFIKSISIAGTKIVCAIEKEKLIDRQKVDKAFAHSKNFRKCSKITMNTKEKVTIFADRLCILSLCDGNSIYF